MYQSSPIKIWRKYRNRYRLIGSHCDQCGKKSYPPVMLCPKCGSTSLSEYLFKPQGKLLTWSVIPAPPKGFEFSAPLIVAIVELEAGERITTQIVDSEPAQLKYGLKLQPTFRKIYVDGDQGVIHYGLKFTPQKDL
jgi:uncharacterized protein